MDLRARRIRVTLRTRKVRKTLTVRKACRLPPLPPPPMAPMTISTIDKRTTPPSSKFIGSYAYFFGPLARSLRVISTMKIQVNMSFRKIRSSSICGSISYEFIAMTTVLIRTHTVSPFSKMLNRMNCFKKHLTFLTRL